MSYAIYEIDLETPAAALHVPDDGTGVALVVRRGRRPVGFAMHACTGPRELAAEEAAVLARAAVASGERVRGEVAATAPGERARDEVTAAASGERARDEVTAAFGTGLPTLTVAVCTRDRPDDLATCLRRLLAVRAAEPDGGAGIELLVVDDAPSDARTRELVATLPHVRYATDPHPGLDFARNRAIEVARGDLLAFVDDDVAVDDSWLQGLKQALVRHPDAAVVTGLVLPAELRTPAQILFERRGGFQKHFVTTRFGAALDGHPFYPCIGGRYGTGCNMAWRRSVLIALGGFDEALDCGAPLPGGGDTDAFYRAVRAGHVLVYEPQFLVFHRHRAGIDQLRRQYARSWGMGLMAHVAKTWREDAAQRPKLRRLVTWWFGNELRELARSLAGRHVLPPLMLAGELWGGVAGLCGTYARSRVRARRIRLQHAAAPDAGPSAAGQA